MANAWEDYKKNKKNASAQNGAEAWEQYKASATTPRVASGKHLGVVADRASSVGRSGGFGGRGKRGDDSGISNSGGVRLGSFGGDVKAREAYLNTRDELKAAADAEQAQVLSPDNLLLKSFVTHGSPSTITQGMQGIFQYVDWLKQSPEWLKYNQYTAAEQEDEKKAELAETAQWAKENPVIGSAASVGTSVLSGADYLSKAIETATVGQPVASSTPGLSEITQAIRGGVSEDMSDTGKFIYNTAMSGIDSLVASVGGSGGAALLGLGAASSTYNDIKERGGSEKQALVGGAVSGIFESLFEKVSIGNFSAMKEMPVDSLKTLFKNYAKSAGVNFTEEALTEVANIAYDYFAMGDLSNYELMARSLEEQYLAQGMSASEAKEKAEKETKWAFIKQVGEAGLSGALMSFGFTTVGTAASEYNAHKTGTDYANRGQQYDLVQLALQGDKNSQSYKMAENIAAKLDASKDATVGSREIGRLENMMAYEAAKAAEDAEKAEKRERLKTAIADVFKPAKAKTSAQITDTVQSMPTTEVEQVAAVQEANPDTHVVPTSVNLFMEAGDDSATAARKSEILARVTSGDTTLSNSQLRKLDLNSAATRAVLQSLTGQAVPQTNDTKTLLNYGRALVDQYAQANAEQAAIQSKIEAMAAEAAEQAETVSAANAEQQIRQPDAEAAAMAQQSEAQTTEAAQPSQTDDSPVQLTDGRSVTKAEFIAQYKAANPGNSDATAHRVYADAVLQNSLGRSYSAAVLQKADSAAQRNTGSQKRSSVDTAKAENQNRSESSATASEGKPTKAQEWTVKRANYVLSKRAGGPKVALRNDLSYNVKGYYDKATKTVYLNANRLTTQQELTYTLGHELVHSVSGEQRTQLVNDICAFYEKIRGAEATQTELDSLRTIYIVQEMRANGMNRTDAEAKVDIGYIKEELAADFMSELMLSTGGLNRIAKENNGWLQTLRSKAVKLMRDLKSKITGNTEARALYNEAEALVDRMDRALKNVQSTDATVSGTKSSLDKGSTETSSSAEAEEAVSSMPKIGDEGTTYEEGGKRYSITSLNHDIAEGKMFDDLVDAGVFTDEEVKILRDNLNDLIEYMLPNANILDMNERYTKSDRPFSVYKQNSDPLYVISLDFSTLCRKRLMTQYVIEKLQLRENRPMSAEEQVAIRSMLLDYRQQEQALQVACAMCYVEAARLKAPKQMERFFNDTEAIMRKYFAKKDSNFNAQVVAAQKKFKREHGYPENAAKKDMRSKDVTALNKMSADMRKGYTPGAEQQAIINEAKRLPRSTFLTAANLTELSIKHPDIYAAYTDHIRASTRSKSLEGDVPYYYGDSRGPVSDSFVDSVNAENGMRFDSWSDFQMKHMLDMITAVIDLSVRRSKMHGYTKFPEMVRIFGKTGMQFNLSGVTEGNGFDENGNLIFSDTEGINFEKAIKLREEFPETAGLQCIGVSDDHIRALLRSKYVDYVIPYHTSGLNATLRKMAGIHRWKDYTGVQHATVDSRAKNPGNVDKWHVEPVWSEFYVPDGRDGNDIMQKTAQRYIDLCHERGLIPKFNDFADEPNYWKLLVDRKMINQETGQIIEQKPVKPIFDFDTIKQEIDREVENYDPSLEQRALQYVVDNFDAVHDRIKDLKKGVKKPLADVANEVLQAYAEGTTEGKRWSIDRDSDYMAAVERGDMETAQKMVDEAAEAAGYTQKGYHGTANHGFTVVDGILWLARDKVVADGYGPYFGVRGESTDKKPYDEKGVYAMYYRLGENLNVYGDGAPWGDLPVSEDEFPGIYVNVDEDVDGTEIREITTNAVVEWADGHYDSVTFENIDDGGLTTVDVIFNPERDAKSADPVTYDDNGNIIPLSQRFNAENKDIRWSIDRDIEIGAEEVYTDSNKYEEENQYGQAGSGELPNHRGESSHAAETTSGETRMGSQADGGREAGDHSQSESSDNRALWDLIMSVPELAKKAGVVVNRPRITRKEAQLALAGLPAENAATAKEAGNRALYARNLATMTSGRLDKVYAEYSYPYNPSSTKAYLTYIDPYDFLALTTRSVEDFLAENPERLNEGENRQWGGQNEIIDSGLMYLRIDEDGNVIGHEGRHRMAALYREGVERVAVALATDRVDDAEPISIRKLFGQKTSGVNSYSSVYVHNMIPVSKEYETINRYAFGDVSEDNHFAKPNIRFSVDSDSTPENINPDTGYQRGSVMDSAMRIYNVSDKDEAIKVLNNFITALEEIEKQHNDEVRAKNTLDALSPKLTEKTIADNRKVIEALIDKFGKMEQTSGAKQEVNLPKQIDEQTKVRGAVQTFAAHDVTDERMNENIVDSILRGEAGTTYKPVSDAETLAAVEKINKHGFKEMRSRWNQIVEGDKLPSKEDIAIGEALYIEACNNKKVDEAMKLIGEISIIGTRMGQAVQAFSLLKSMTPSGKAYYLQKTVDSLNASKDIKRRGIKLKLDKKLVENLLTAQTSADVAAAEEAILDNLAKQIPPTVADMIDLWRYTAMLTNVSTHVRNVAGNALFVPVRSVKNTVATLLETTFIKDQSKRTTTIKVDKDLMDFAFKDADTMREELQGGGRHGIKDKILSKREVFGYKGGKIGKAMDKVANWNSELMELEDWGLGIPLTDFRLPGLRSAYAKALGRFLQARGFTAADVFGENSTPEGRAALDQARVHAMKEAQKATFRDYSKLASKIAQLQRDSGPVARVLWGGVLPFTKTPINVLRRGIDYSPAGLARAIWNGVTKLSDKNSEYTATDFISELSEGLTGSAVFALGGFLAYLGMLVGHVGDDDEEKYKEQQGYQEYSITVGDTNYTLNWAAPFALPLFAGAEFYKMTKDFFDGDDDFDFFGAVESILGLANPMLAMSMLSGINDTLKTVRNDRDTQPFVAILTELVGSYAGQFIPSILGAAARIKDPYSRGTFTPAGERGLEKFADKWFQKNIMGKSPFLIDDKILYLDNWGRADSNGNILMRAFANLLSPGYAEAVSTTPVDLELERLYGITANSSIFPSKPDKSFKVDKVDYIMTQDEYQAFSIDKGQHSYSLVNDIINDRLYSGMSDKIKTEAVLLAYEYATNIAKIRTNPEYDPSAKWLLKLYELEQNGGDVAEYLLLRAESNISDVSLTEAALGNSSLTDNDVLNIAILDTTLPESFTDPYTTGHEYIMNSAQQKQYEQFYRDYLAEEYSYLIEDSAYQEASVSERYEMLKDIKEDVGKLTRKAMSDWLWEQGIEPTPKN